MTQRAFVGTSSVQRTFTDELGTAYAPSSVTVTASAHDGTTVSLGARTNPSTGVYVQPFTCLTPSLVTFTWLVDGVTQVDTVDVQAAPLLTVAELRAADTSLSNTTTYPNSVLADAIEDAEAECMAITGRSWARRYCVETLSTRDGRVQLSWPHVASIGKVTVDGTDAGASYRLRAAGVVEVYSATSGAIIEVGYEHGLLEPNREIRRALLIRARQFAQTPTSAVSMFTERVQVGDLYTTTRMLPKAGSTGVAEVDAIYRRNAFAGGVSVA